PLLHHRSNLLANDGLPATGHAGEYVKNAINDGRGLRRVHGGNIRLISHFRRMVPAYREIN
ncbi:hypothetical protein, partial [Herbaspirillum sp. B65]|uniref:hypothetical protein n=1 Tax=Herbaspirillum sp. B65 TaxID=137708 RepID=UPI001C26C3F9